MGLETEVPIDNLLSSKGRRIEDPTGFLSNSILLSILIISLNNTTCKSCTKSKSKGNIYTSHLTSGARISTEELVMAVGTIMDSKNNEGRVKYTNK